MARASSPAARASARTLNNVLLVTTTLVATLVILFPVFWMVNAAVRPIAEILTYPPSLVPKELTLKFFGNMLGNEQYRRYYLNQPVLTETMWLPQGAWDACRVEGMELVEAAYAERSVMPARQIRVTAFGNRVQEAGAGVVSLVGLYADPIGAMKRALNRRPEVSA